MATLNISLPDNLKAYIEARVSEGDYQTTSEYLRDLIRKDQKRKSQEHLETLLVRGIELPASEWTQDSAASIQSAVRERLAFAE